MSSKMKVHAVVGNGSAPTAVVQAGLHDAIGRNDAVSLVWMGPPSDTMEDVYDYVFDNQIAFQMFYAEGATPPRVFREADNGAVQKVRDPYKAALQSVENGGKVLYLWDEEADDDQVEPIFDVIERGTLVLELTNGLAPISIDMDIPEPQEREVEKSEDDATDEADEDTRFTKEELETMTAFAVKRYGATLGLEAVTKSGIIKELFPEPPVGEDDEAEEVEPGKTDVSASEAPSSPSAISEDEPGNFAEEEFIDVMTKIDLAVSLIKDALTQLAKKVYSS